MSERALNRFAGFALLVFLSDLGIALMVASTFLAITFSLITYRFLFFVSPGEEAEFFAFAIGVFKEAPLTWVQILIMLTPSTIVAGFIGLFYLFKGRLGIGTMLAVKGWLVFVGLLMFVGLYMRGMEDENFTWVAEFSQRNGWPEWIFGAILLVFLYLSYKAVTKAILRILPLSKDLAEAERKKRTPFPG